MGGTFREAQAGMSMATMRTHAIKRSGGRREPVMTLPPSPGPCPSWRYLAHRVETIEERPGSPGTRRAPGGLGGRPEPPMKSIQRGQPLADAPELLAQGLAVRGGGV